ncbi:hypothetical protein [Paenibacillus faecalis]|nr:hypothetical protein [Paenibacillus faecalis]
MKKRVVLLLTGLFVTVSLSAYVSAAAPVSETGITVQSDRQTGTVKW